MCKKNQKISSNTMQIIRPYKPCKPDLFRRFMKKHKNMNVNSKMKQAPIKPATSKTYGFGALAEFLLVVMTLGSIGAGVEGSVKKQKKTDFILIVVFLKIKLNR